MHFTVAEEAVCCLMIMHHLQEGRVTSTIIVLVQTFSGRPIVLACEVPKSFVPCEALPGQERSSGAPSCSPAWLCLLLVHVVIDVVVLGCWWWVPLFVARGGCRW